MRLTVSPLSLASRLGQLGEVAARLRVAHLARAGGDVAAGGVPLDEAVALQRVERRVDAVGRRLRRRLELEHGPRGALEHEREHAGRELGGVHALRYINSSHRRRAVR
jgi:hypothetical protein